ncbi:hypothetical protein [Nonomuraea basaltis]|nr:hypothetical protein [Nonomuraea basaltis]
MLLVLGIDRASASVVTPTWVKLIHFETTLPSAVEELLQRWEERQHA